MLQVLFIRHAMFVKCVSGFKNHSIATANIVSPVKNIQCLLMKAPQCTYNWNCYFCLNKAEFESLDLYIVIVIPGTDWMYTVWKVAWINTKMP